MNPSPPEASRDYSGTRPTDLPPGGWAASLADLASARIAIIEHECRAVASKSIRKLILFIAAGLAGLFSWLLLVIALIGMVAALAAWPWYWVALGFAALHLLGAALLVSSAKRHVAKSFAITRAEFQKDREWLHSLHPTRKSSN